MRTGQPSGGDAGSATARQAREHALSRYWKGNLRAVAWLLALWFLVSFGVSYFARELRFEFFGWSFSYWMGAQGSLLIYLGIVWGYARIMSRLDREHGVAEDD